MCLSTQVCVPTWPVARHCVFCSPTRGVSARGVESLSGLFPSRCTLGEARAAQAVGAPAMVLTLSVMPGRGPQLPRTQLGLKLREEVESCMKIALLAESLAPMLTV